MHGMKRPNIQEQMPNPMTLEQVGMVLSLDMSLKERGAGRGPPVGRARLAA